MYFPSHIGSSAVGGSQLCMDQGLLPGQTESPQAGCVDHRQKEKHKRGFFFETKKNKNKETVKRNPMVHLAGLLGPCAPPDRQETPKKNSKKKGSQRGKKIPTQGNLGGSSIKRGWESWDFTMSY